MFDSRRVWQRVCVSYSRIVSIHIIRVLFCVYATHTCLEYVWYIIILLIELLPKYYCRYRQITHPTVWCRSTNTGIQPNKMVVRPRSKGRHRPRSNWNPSQMKGKTWNHHLPNYLNWENIWHAYGRNITIMASSSPVPASSQQGRSTSWLYSIHLSKTYEWRSPWFSGKLISLVISYIISYYYIQLIMISYNIPTKRLLWI